MFLESDKGMIAWRIKIFGYKMLHLLRVVNTTNQPLPSQYLMNLF